MPEGVWRSAVLLEHIGHGACHGDLIIARGARCPTIRVVLEPALAFIWSAPHRRKYLTYAGPVGGGRGIVRRWWRGRVRLVGVRLSLPSDFPGGARMVVPLPAAPLSSP